MSSKPFGAETQTGTTFNVIPCRGDRYLEMWAPLLEIEKVYIPVGFSDQGGAPSMSDDERLLSIDNMKWSDGGDHALGLVYTDSDLLTSSVSICEMPVAQALSRFLHNPMLCGVVFNQTINTSSCGGGGLPAGTMMADMTHDSPWSQPACRETLSRVLGMLTSPDPFAGVEYEAGQPMDLDEESAARHADLAAQAIEADQPLVAMHHAACARNGELATDDWFFIELDACLMLSLTERAVQLVTWYASEFGHTPALRVREAYLTSISGRPDEAIDIAAPLVDDEDLGSHACLELARAHYIAGRYEKAVASFDAATERGEEGIDALIGKGMALRILHWESSDRDGLSAAGERFQRAIEMGDYHKPEAQHHLSTICLAQGDFENGELLAREALADRVCGITRRNLVLFLHSQGRVDEAFQQYQLLQRFDPAHAQGLEVHFDVMGQARKAG